ncbi:MAG: YigZ family protein [Candidatus Marinimicrobia bacterium]|nr:YigZ family protein [Candidatus Neomarinimicrobiota bacterium]
MYREVVESTSSLEKIKNSKFLVFVHPVRNLKEVEVLIEQYKAEHHKANHIVRAYRMLTTQGIIAYNTDDGEPGRSSGPPIEAALEGRNLVNTLVVVVRYFGGIKLGVGGLIRAYGGSAARLLDRTKTREIIKHSIVQIHTPHRNYSDVMFIMEQTGLKFEQEYSLDGAVIRLNLPEKDVPEICSRFNPFPDIIIKVL